MFKSILDFFYRPTLKLDSKLELLFENDFKTHENMRIRAVAMHYFRLTCRFNQYLINEGIFIAAMADEHYNDSVTGELVVHGHIDLKRVVTFTYRYEKGRLIGREVYYYD